MSDSDQRDHGDGAAADPDAVPAPSLLKGKAAERETAQVFQSVPEAAERLGMHRTHIYTLRSKDMFLDPDVLIGTVAGFSEARLEAWGMETGRLHPDGTIRKDRKGRPRYKATPERTDEDGVVHPAKPAKPEHWNYKTVAYLTQDECGALLGISGIAVNLLRRRGTFTMPRVRVGDTYGWSYGDVARFALRNGRKILPLSSLAAEAPATSGNSEE